MYFVTDEPTLFTIGEPSHAYIRIVPKGDFYMVLSLVGSDLCELFKGDYDQCQDFIFALAGWVGAVNPMKAGADNG